MHWDVVQCKTAAARLHVRLPALGVQRKRLRLRCQVAYLGLCYVTCCCMHDATECSRMLHVAGTKAESCTHRLLCCATCHIYTPTSLHQSMLEVSMLQPPLTCTCRPMLLLTPGLKLLITPTAASICCSPCSPRRGGEATSAVQEPRQPWMLPSFLTLHVGGTPYDQ